MPLSTSTLRLNQSRATALFVIPTTAGPTFLAAWTTGVLRASDIEAVDFGVDSATVVLEELVLVSLPQPPSKIPEETRQTVNLLLN